MSILMRLMLDLLSNERMKGSGKTVFFIITTSSVTDPSSFRIARLRSFAVPLRTEVGECPRRFSALDLIRALRAQGLTPPAALLGRHRAGVEQLFEEMARRVSRRRPVVGVGEGAGTGEGSDVTRQRSGRLALRAPGRSAPAAASFRPPLRVILTRKTALSP
jgi:hypothetical protein